MVPEQAPQTKKIKAVKTRKLKMLPRVLQKCAIMSASELKKMPQKRKSKTASGKCLLSCTLIRIQIETLQKSSRKLMRLINVSVTIRVVHGMISIVIKY